MLDASNRDQPSPGTQTIVVSGDGKALRFLRVTATKLRERVRVMRKNVLGGGPSVEKSEKEALRFYRRKLEQLARRTDELHTQRDMKQAEYNVALDATLKSSDAQERDQAARDANRLRRCGVPHAGLKSQTSSRKRLGKKLVFSTVWGVFSRVLEVVQQRFE